MSCNTKECCETTITQKGINEKVSLTVDSDNNLKLVIGNRIYTVELPETGGGSGVNYEKITIPITSNNQTVFSNVIPSAKTFFTLFLNGVEPDNDEFSISGSNVVWLNTTNSPLETSDILKIWVK